MLINLETDMSLNEIENILSNKTCQKYPFFNSEYNLGINWVRNSKNFICLFYESGAKDRWGYQTKVKSFFYGKVIRVNGKYRILGISCVNLFFIIITLMILTAVIINGGGFNCDSVFGIFFLCIISVLFTLDISKDSKKIKNYLERQFCKGD